MRGIRASLPDAAGEWITAGLGASSVDITTQRQETLEHLCDLIGALDSILSVGLAGTHFHTDIH